MTSEAESLGSTDASTRNDPHDHEKTPLWKFVEKMERTAGGGNTKFKCNYCKEIFNGSYSRVKAHLLRESGMGVKKCSKVTDAIFVQLKKIVEEADAKLNASRPTIPLPPTSTRASSTFTSRTEHGFYNKKKRKGSSEGSSNPLEKSFNVGGREELDKRIARMFYANGISFNLAKSPHYVGAFTHAANSSLSGYVPPGYNKLRTTLLEQERMHVDNMLLPIKQSWGAKGVSIVADGWTDPQRRPLINFMAISENGPVFLKAIDASGEYKDKHFIADLIMSTINEVGPHNVVQVITDNAPVCKAAGLIVESHYPQIFWTPCVVHTLNLALKNICAAKNTEDNEEVYNECHWITEVANEGTEIKNFILNHSMVLSIFKSFSRLKLLSTAETRFASIIIMLKRIKDVKHALQQMVISEEWAYFRDDDVRKAQSIKERILDDIWWDKVDYILDFTKPIIDMLRAADTDKPMLHLIYEMWDTMIENVKAMIFQHESRSYEDESSFYRVVHEILQNRWNKSNTPLHCLAHSLNPRYVINNFIICRIKC